jgi:hypothetical protein
LIFLIFKSQNHINIILAIFKKKKMVTDQNERSFDERSYYDRGVGQKMAYQDIPLMELLVAGYYSRETISDSREATRLFLHTIKLRPPWLTDLKNLF